MKITTPVKVLLLLLLLFAFIPDASAHVKWFTEGSYADRPLKFDEVLDTRYFTTLFIVCVIVVVLGVWLDSRIMNARWYNRMNNWLESRKSYSVIVMRFGAAMVLILSWQGNAMMVPTLGVPLHYEWLGWFQFVLAFFLLIPRLVPIGGLGIVFIWVLGNFLFHPFHMLDYLMFGGCGAYLFLATFRNGKWKETALVVLYVAVGFSLCWVALEKFIYPNWSLILVREHPSLSMGFNPDFFIKSVGFVEFGLGYLLIVCLLQRPLAVIITITFFLTSSVFGKTEIIGHTMIHGALIVFLLEGPGKFYIRLRNRFSNVYKRMGFTFVNFIVLFVILILAYSALAQMKYDQKQKFLAKKPDHVHEQIDMAGYPKEELPAVWMDIETDPAGGYNIHFITRNFAFTPENINKEHVMGQGFAQLYVDDIKVARVYNEWFYLPPPEPGEHVIKVVLNSNNHAEYVIRGEPIGASEPIKVTSANLGK